jgi:transcription elongation factor GreB
MGRWRSPSPKSSPYITPEGFQFLGKELNKLWNRRMEVTRALSAAASEGDRSENAEYIYRKKELREIDARIRYLQTRISKLKVVSEVGDKTRIFFGAIVTIEDQDGKQTRYRIVGADEFDYKDYYISVDSPIGKAMLGKTLDDEIIIKAGGRTRRYFITAIEYNME